MTKLLMSGFCMLLHTYLGVNTVPGMMRPGNCIGSFWEAASLLSSWEMLLARKRIEEVFGW